MTRGLILAAVTVSALAAVGWQVTSAPVSVTCSPDRFVVEHEARDDRFYMLDWETPREKSSAWMDYSPFVIDIGPYDGRPSDPVTAPIIELPVDRWRVVEYFDDGSLLAVQKRHTGVPFTAEDVAAEHSGECG